MPGEMRKISIKGNVMRQEKRSFPFFLLTLRALSTRVSTGTLTPGTHASMREILISRNHFSNSGENSKKSCQCLERLSPILWRTLTTQITVAASRTVISVLMGDSVKIVSILPICGIRKTVSTVSVLSDVSLVMSSPPLSIAIKYTSPMM